MMPVAIGSIVDGPIWMDLLAGAQSWRWAFVSEPLIIALYLFFASMVIESPRTKQTQFDGWGALMTYVGLGLIVLDATLAGEFGCPSVSRPPALFRSD
jgi:hypothetical protein